MSSFIELALMSRYGDSHRVRIAYIEEGQARTSPFQRYVVRKSRSEGFHLPSSTRFMVCATATVCESRRVRVSSVAGPRVARERAAAGRGPTSRGGGPQRGTVAMSLCAVHGRNAEKVHGMEDRKFTETG